MVRVWHVLFPIRRRMPLYRTPHVDSDAGGGSLSVSKWIHLNWGDQGLRRLFHKVFRMLSPVRCPSLLPLSSHR